jgi:hypothetical protein
MKQACATAAISDCPDKARSEEPLRSQYGLQMRRDPSCSAHQLTLMDHPFIECIGRGGVT